MEDSHRTLVSLLISLVPPQLGSSFWCLSIVIKELKCTVSALFQSKSGHKWFESAKFWFMYRHFGWTEVDLPIKFCLPSLLENFRLIRAAGYSPAALICIFWWWGSLLPVVRIKWHIREDSPIRIKCVDGGTGLVFSFTLLVEWKNLTHLWLA